MKIKWISLMLPVFTSAMWTAEGSYDSIDRHALKAPYYAEQKVESLAGYLIKPARNDRDKIRAIFRWITANISYDTQAYFIGKPQNHGSGDILRDRTAVCDGFSTLIEMLGKEAGLNIVKINGHAKGYDYRIGDHFSGPSNHAWNAVWIDGRWELLDATWGAGYIDESGEFIREFNDHFFCTDPEDMIFTHFPDNPRWQLLATPVSQREFESLPYLKPAYFRYRLKIKSHKKGEIISDGRLELILENPENAALIARLMKDSRYLGDHYSLVQNRNMETSIRVSFPEKGIYTLRLFARDRNEEGLYTWSMDYRIRVKSGQDASAGFPEIFRSYKSHQAVLNRPLSGRLRKNTQVSFDITIPDAIEASVIQGDQWISLEKHQDRFTGIITVKQGELRIGARFSQKPNFDILLKYRVE